LATRRQPEDPQQAPNPIHPPQVVERDDPSAHFAERYRVVESLGGDLYVHERRGRLRRPSHEVRGLNHDRFFLAEKRPDGTYTVTLTEAGVKTFETALGIANDLGGSSLISPYSTIADIMERTATREELSDELRSDDRGLLHWLRVLVLRRKLRGSERPDLRQRIIGHVGKILIVLLFVYWTIQQFATAIGDIVAIPGILGNAPADILHPLSAFGQVGANISDAGHHFLLGVVGIHLVWLVAVLIKPFARIYRKDQIISGERSMLRMLNTMLRRIARGMKRARSRREPAHSTG
jgi:hypothetical protein